MVLCRGNRKEAVVTQNINWEGRFNAVPREYALQVQETFRDFLGKGNLLYPGVTVIAYDLLCEKPQPVRIRVLQAPNHCDFADFAVNVPYLHRHTLLWTGMATRVLWKCRGMYPAELGIPSPRRLSAAAGEYSTTGKVTTLHPCENESLRYAHNDSQDWYGERLRERRASDRRYEDRELLRRVFGTGRKGWRPGLKSTLSGQVRRHGRSFGSQERGLIDMSAGPIEGMAEAAE